MLLGGKALGIQRAARALLQVRVHRVDVVGLEVAVAAYDRLHVVVAHVDGEQPERGNIARVLRHDDGPQAEDVDQTAHQERPGAAEGRQREVAHVEAALDRDLPDRVGLVPRRDLQHADRRPVRLHVEAIGKCNDPRGCSGYVEWDLTAEQVRRDAS